MAPHRWCCSPKDYRPKRVRCRYRAPPRLPTRPPAWAEAEGMICFTPRTLIRTPHGESARSRRCGRAIWSRRATVVHNRWSGRGGEGSAGASVCAAATAPGAGGDAGAVCSGVAAHLVLVHGDVARNLFGTPEVMVPAGLLPRARVDHVVTEVTYIHVALPAHHAVWANGVSVETFHPARVAPGTLDAAQEQALAQALPVLDDGPWAFGDTARRVLAPAEAALLAYGLSRRGEEALTLA